MDNKNLLNILDEISEYIDFEDTEMDPESRTAIQTKIDELKANYTEESLMELINMLQIQSVYNKGLADMDTKVSASFNKAAETALQRVKETGEKIEDIGKGYNKLSDDLDKALAEEEHKAELDELKAKDQAELQATMSQLNQIASQPGQDAQVQPQVAQQQPQMNQYQQPNTAPTAW